jgi:Fic family protein
LEGNTYSILDTHLLLEQGKVAEGKSAEETQMIMNHKEAIEFLVDSANEIGFNRHTILNLHSLLANNLLDPQATGRLRQGLIGIGKSVYIPLQLPQVIEECFGELLARAEAISDPFEQSFFASIQLPYLQPFLDVNKRVSRLAANIPFIKQNISPLSFIEVPESMYAEAMLGVYELNKTELARDMFVWAYERSARRYAAIQQSLGAPDQFRMKYKEELRGAVSDVVQNKLTKEDASKFIEDFATSAVPEADRARFVEIAETELIGLHEGNFARFRLRPSQFFAWKAVWEAA